MGRAARRQDQGFVALLAKPGGEPAGGLAVEADPLQDRSLAAQAAEIVDHRRLDRRVERALAEVKTLRGLLPICSGGERIKGDDGKKWEVYYEIKTGELVAEESK